MPSNRDRVPFLPVVAEPHQQRSLAVFRTRSGFHPVGMAPGDAWGFNPVGAARRDVSGFNPVGVARRDVSGFNPVGAARRERYSGVCR